MTPLTLEEATDLLICSVLSSRDGLLANGLASALAADVANGAPIPSASEVKEIVQGDRAKLYPLTTVELEDIWS